MIQGWKLRREIKRLVQQLQAIPEYIWEPFARRAHDAAFDRGFPVTEGSLLLCPKVALVLCWQPGGLSQSFFAMLTHLVDCGYAPLVVSNASLSETDLKQLSKVTWRVVQRPNFGYDFGGYRDGLRLLQRWEVRPDRLVILNDSVWFPLWTDDDTLLRAERATYSVVGSILRERGDIRFLESYFFSIDGTILNDLGFCSFWSDLRLTSNKYKVIRRGERGFGQALQAAGISFGPLFSRADVDTAISRLSTSELRLVVDHMAAVERAVLYEKARLALLADEPTWEQSARIFVGLVLERFQFYSSFPVLAAKYLRYPFLKKSSEPVSAEWRSKFVLALRHGLLPAVLPICNDEIVGSADRKPE